MYGKYELEFLLSSVARGSAPIVGGHGFRQEETSPGAGQAREGRAIASDHERQNIDPRLRHVETRLAYVNVSLTYMEAYRTYIGLRLEDAAEDVAYAGDTGLAFEEVRLLYADDYSASPGDGGLLGQVDAALGSIRACLAEIDAHPAQARSGQAYIGEEVVLSYVEAGLADIEVGLVGIGATLAHVDALLSEVLGAGTGAPTLVRIPLPSAGS